MNDAFTLLHEYQIRYVSRLLSLPANLLPEQPVLKEKRPMKLVTGSQAAREKEVEIRLMAHDVGIAAVLFVDGDRVPHGMLGWFYIVNGKIQFLQNVHLNKEYVHTTGTLDEIRLV